MLNNKQTAIILALVFGFFLGQLPYERFLAAEAHIGSGLTADERHEIWHYIRNHCEVVRGYEELSCSPWDGSHVD